MSKRTVSFSFQCQACQQQDLRIAAFQGVEGLGRPFEFELKLAGKAVDAEKMLDAAASLTLLCGQRTQTYHGFLVWFMETGVVQGLHRYRALLAPDFTRLERNVTSAVHVQKSVPDILKELLTKAHLQSGTDFDFKLKGQYDKRELVCRCQESELNFLHRVSQRAGIYYFFQPGASEGEPQKLLFADSPEAHAPPGADDVMTYLEASGLEHGQTTSALHTFSLDLRQSVEKVIIDDYNPERPELAISAQERAGKSPGQERFFGGMAATRDQAQHTARVRKELLACQAKKFTGKLDAPLVRSGYCCSVESHPLQAFNADYLVTQVRHEGVQPLGSGHGAGVKARYSASFEAIPAAGAFRPQWTAPWPRIAGVLSATIAAEGSGEYAEVDEQGRYQVVLPFGQQPDQTPKTAKIRMLQPYGGGEHGVHFPLHKGTEVLLAFLQGDPDRPVICGAAPNVNTPSVVSKKQNTAHCVKTASGNQFLADDNESNNHLLLCSPTADTRLVLGTMPEDGHKKHLQSIQDTAQQIITTAGGSGGDTSQGESAFQKWWTKHTQAKGKGCGLHMLTGGLLGTDVGFSNSIILGDIEKICIGNSIKDVLVTDFNFTCGPSLSADWGTKYKGTLGFQIVRDSGTKTGFNICSLNGDVKEAIGERSKAAKSHKKAEGARNKAAAHEGKLTKKKTSLTEQQNALKGSIQNINQKLGRLINEKEALEGEVNELTKSSDELQDEVALLTQTRNRLRNTINSLTEERSQVANTVMLLAESKLRASEEANRIVTEDIEI